MIAPSSIGLDRKDWQRMTWIKTNKIWTMCTILPVHCIHDETIFATLSMWYWLWTIVYIPMMTHFPGADIHHQQIQRSSRFRQSCLDRRHQNNSWSACLWTSINLIKQTYITCVWETTEIDSQNNWGWTWWWLVFLTQLLSNQSNLIHGLRIDWEKLCCLQCSSYSYYILCWLTLKRSTGASEAQVPIQNYLYCSIFISAQCFKYSSKNCFEHSPVISWICCNKKRLLVTFEKKLTQRAKVSLIGPCSSECLVCWQPNGTSLKEDVYMSSRALWPNV